MISPTGNGTRGQDQHGNGRYGAGRGNRLHTGADYVCIPGTPVVCPIKKGKIVREKRPYAGYSGLLIRNRDVEITLFYLEPDKNLIGYEVNQGDVIGIAQDISEKYPGIIPHIHMQIDSINPELFINLP